MNEQSLHIRKAEMSDIMLYFEWANDPDVRRNSFNQEPILLTAHEHWFSKKLTSHDTYLYVLEYNGQPAGQIRFEVVTASEVDETDGITQAEIGFSLGSNFRGKGLGTLILQMGSQNLISELPKPLTIRGAVKADNHASNAAFQKAGFVFDAKTSTNDVFYYVRYYNCVGKP